MTRYARGNKGSHRRPHEASSWTELRGQVSHGTGAAGRRSGTPKANGRSGPRLKGKKRKPAPLPSDGHIVALPTVGGAGGDLSSALRRRLAPPLEGDQGACNNDGTETAEKKAKRTEQRRQKRIKSRANKMVKCQLMHAVVTFKGRA